MKLQQGNQFEILRANRRLKTPPVFLYVVPRVPFRKSQVQHPLAIQLAHPAPSRAKAVHQPWQFRQPRRLQDANSAPSLLRPPRRSFLSCGPPPPLISFAPSTLGSCHKSVSIITDSGCLPLGRGKILIIGLGVDIAEVPRIQAAIEGRGQRFLDRVFTPNEIAYCERFKNKFERYAGRFAAKEAAMKALGTGWRRGIRWVDLEVVREQSGRPSMSLAGEAAKIAAQLGVKRISLSITHTQSEALAQVIFED
jgi:holo-[acyl-carrier protein] synthase